MLLENIWLDLRNYKSDKLVLDVFNNLPLRRIMILPELHEEIAGKFGKRAEFIYFIRDKEMIGVKSNCNILISDNEEALLYARKRKVAQEYGLYVNVFDKKSLNESWKNGMQYDYLLIEFKDETNIPLELIIAQLKNNGIKTKLFKVVNSIEDALIASQVLESGADGVLFKGAEALEKNKFDELLYGRQKVKLEECLVTDVKYIGAGDRGCLDTVSLLGQNEGMIIGSTSAGGILVCSETHYLPYMELRPFRVNAGAVHSYVLAENGTTKH